MACYISRLDDQGNEIEHISSRASSVSTRPTGSRAGSNRRSFRQRSVRFINSAAYIERIEEREIECYYPPTSVLGGRKRLDDDVDETGSVNCDVGLNCEEGEHSDRSYDSSDIGSLNDDVGWYERLNSKISETSPKGDMNDPQSGVSEAESVASDVDDNASVNSEPFGRTSHRNCNSISSKIGRRFGRDIEIPRNPRSCSSILSGFSDTSSLNDLDFEEKQSNIVPPLDIPSTDYTTSPRWQTYSKSALAPKIIRAPNLAYQEWLSAKRRIKAEEAARRKQEEEEKRKEKEERLRLAKEKYDQWLKNKARQQTSSDKKQPEPEKDKTKKKLSEQEARAKLEEWERKKRLEEERRRQIKFQEEQRRQEWEEKRRQMSAEAWEKWVRDAAKKPKPVPLNRGIFTLRGTVSDIYVNPNEWKHILPLVDDY